MAKRPRMRQGEGSLFPRKDSTGRTIGWTAQISIGDRGHRRRITRVRRTYAEARAVLRELVEEQRAGLNPSKLSLSRYLEGWIADVRNLRPSTQRAYTAAITWHIVPALGEIPLRDLMSLHVERFLADLATRLGPKSQRNVHAVLRRALNSAVRSGLLVRNVASRQFVDAPRVPRAEPRALTAAEVGRLLEQLRGEPIEPIVIVALATGLRQGEVLGLTWEDIDWRGHEEAQTRRSGVGRRGDPALASPESGSAESAGGSRRGGMDASDSEIRRLAQQGTGTTEARVTVRRELRRIVGPTRKTGRYVRDELKTPRSRRTVPLPPPAVAALRAHQQRLRKAGFLLTMTGQVFPNRRGDALNGSWVTKQLQAAMLRAGVGKGDFRMLRRTFASRLFAAGVPDRYVADLLGHTSTAISHQHYISTGTDAHRALQALEEMLA
jgi:integrase